MAPISRRMFLIGSVSIVIAACSDDSSGSSNSTPSPSSPNTEPTASTDGQPPSTGTATTSAPETTTTLAAVDLPGDPFTLGVASGDPDTTSVILWTRLAPDPINGGGMPDDDIDVLWELADSEDFARVIASGTVTARPLHGHSVHATTTPPAGTTGRFFYRFRVGDYVSPIGRTSLAPAGSVSRATFVSSSCQNYEDGFYAAHRDIAAQSPDFLVWLGDYIYESGGGPTVEAGKVRTHGAPEPMDLVAYRNRYALYKLDSDLQAAHASCPWFVIWDDHEVENNYAGLSPQDPADAPTFEARRQQAYKAWWEHQPVRLDPPPDSGEYRIYRSVLWGDLIGMTLLDTRQYRTDQACGDVTLSLEPACPETFDDTRTLTGAEQEQWIFEDVGTHGTAWNVIAQQVVMANITLNGAVLNYDQWDGYPKDRQRILQHLADVAVPNAIVLSGDIHLAGVSLLRAGDPGVGQAVAVEFIDTSISSAGSIPADASGLAPAFPDIVDFELVHRGYTIHTVTPEQWSAAYRIVDNATVEDSPVTTYKTFVVDSGMVAVRVEV
jgi:alkaline phosphatase D